MATCPECGLNSKEDLGAISLEQKLVIGQPLGAPKGPGGETFVAKTRWVLSCICGWSIVGSVRDGSFYADKVQPKGQR